MNRAERRKQKKKSSEKTYTFNSHQAMVQATLRGPGQEAMDKEIKRQLLNRVEELELDMDAAILWTLHKRFGFGKKRLEEFFWAYLDEYTRMRELYQMDDCYPELYKLREIGVDVEKLRRESNGML